MGGAVVCAGWGLGGGGGGGGGGLLISHSLSFFTKILHPALFFITFPNSVFFKKNTFVKNKLITAKVNHDCKMQIDPHNYYFQ